MQCGLSFLLLVSATFCRVGGAEEDVGTVWMEVDAGESPLGSWRPRERTHGWGADKSAPALRIRDGDSKTAARHRTSWLEWRKKLGAHRTYRNWTDEELHARIFEESEAIVAENMEAFVRGEALYELGINELADLTEEEFAQFAMNPAVLNANNELFAFPNDDSAKAKQTGQARAMRNIPANYDWRDQITFSAVKNQGTCGSCYAFAAVGTIEAQVFITRKIVVDLSAQYLIDCTKGVGPNNMNFGCEGGLPYLIFDWLIENKKGLLRSDTYPYTKNDTGRCPPCISEAFQLKSFVLRNCESEVALRGEVIEYGPATALIYSKASDFQLYKRVVDHAVVVVGYGLEAGRGYWILRNSWGSTWGEDGYMKLESGVNRCGFPNITAWPQLI